MKTYNTWKYFVIFAIILFFCFLISEELGFTAAVVAIIALISMQNKNAQAARVNDLLFKNQNLFTFYKDYLNENLRVPLDSSETSLLFDFCKKDCDINSTDAMTKHSCSTMTVVFEKRMLNLANVFIGDGKIMIDDETISFIQDVYLFKNDRNFLLKNEDVEEFIEKYKNVLVADSALESRTPETIAEATRLKELVLENNMEKMVNSFLTFYEKFKTNRNPDFKNLKSKETKTQPFAVSLLNFIAYLISETKEFNIFRKDITPLFDDIFIAIAEEDEDLQLIVENIIDKSSESNFFNFLYYAHQSITKKASLPLDLNCYNLAYFHLTAFVYSLDQES